MKNVIHIYGAAGSGTTTLGKKISDELGYTLMDTDDYFWMPTEPKFTLKRPREERIELMKRDIEPGGDMYQHHIDFVNWAKAYDNGGTDIRSKAMHDEWQKKLLCKILYLDGADKLEDNFAKVLGELGIGE